MTWHDFHFISFFEKNFFPIFEKKIFRFSKIMTFRLFRFSKKSSFRKSCHSEKKSAIIEMRSRGRGLGFAPKIAVIWIPIIFFNYFFSHFFKKNTILIEISKEMHFFSGKNFEWGIIIKKSVKKSKYKNQNICNFF